MRIYKIYLGSLDHIYIFSKRSTVFLVLPKQEMVLYDGRLWVLPQNIDGDSGLHMKITWMSDK